MKREREKKITRLHIILFFLVVTITVTTIIIIKTSGSSQIKKYKALEKNLNLATVYYYGSKTSELRKGGTKIITMDTLVKNGYLQDEITSKCTGYTIVSNYRTIDGEYEIGYNSYIKCGDKYTTVGFSKENLSK